MEPSAAGAMPLVVALLPLEMVGCMLPWGGDIWRWGSHHVGDPDGGTAVGKVEAA